MSDKTESGEMILGGRNMQERLERHENTESAKDSMDLAIALSKLPQGTSSISGAWWLNAAAGLIQASFEAWHAIKSAGLVRGYAENITELASRQSASEPSGKRENCALELEARAKEYERYGPSEAAKQYRYAAEQLRESPGYSRPAPTAENALLTEIDTLLAHEAPKDVK